MSDSARNLIIDIQKLAKSYPMGNNIVHALKGVDLKIYQGDSLSIMGPSGSGKSTLMHLLGCLDSPTSGQYFFNHQNISELTDDELAVIRASKIGFVFQSFNLIPQLNVLENIEVPFLYQPTPPPTNLKEIIIDALAKVGLGSRLYHHPSELSGGEMQRVAIARALATNPLLILADEPTGNLDTANGLSILKLFEKLHAEGVTIVTVTHDQKVADHSERFVRMQDGLKVEEKSK